MKDYTNSGFTRYSNSIYNAILVVSPKFTAREYRIINLLIRLTVGCGIEWATLKKSDLKIVGVGITHARSILEKLIDKSFILKQGFCEYKINEEQITLLAYCMRVQNDRLRHVIGTQLHNKKDQTGYIKPFHLVTNVLPDRKGMGYQYGNKVNGLVLPISILNQSRLGQPKDSIKEENKENIKEIINTNNEKKQKRYPDINPHSFVPSTDVQETALRTWHKIEPHNPKSFNFYIWSAHKGLPEDKFLQLSDIAMSKSPEDRGRYFNGMVRNYLKEEGLIDDE